MGGIPNQYQLVEAPIGGGLDQKTDYRKVALGKLVSCENTALGKNGIYKKRFGFSNIGKSIRNAGGNLPQVYQSAAYNDALVAMSAEAIHTYSDDDQLWSTIDELPQTVATRFPVSGGIWGPVDADVAYYSPTGITDIGYMVFTWLADTDDGARRGTVYVRIVDVASGAIVFTYAISRSRNCRNPKVIVSGDYAGIFWRENPNTYKDIAGLTVELAAGTFAVSAISVFVTNGGIPAPAAWPAGEGAAGYDVTAIEGATAFALVYATAAGVVTLKRGTLGAGGVTIGTTAAGTEAGLTTDTPFAIQATSGERIWIAYRNDAPAVRMAAYDATTLAETIAPFTVAHQLAVTYIVTASTFHSFGLARISSTQCVLTISVVSLADADTEATGLDSFIVDTSPGIVGAHRTVFGVVAESRPFVLSGKAYCLVKTLHPQSQTDNGGGNDTTAPTTLGSYFLVDLRIDKSTIQDAPKPVCCIAPRQIAGRLDSLTPTSNKFSRRFPRNRSSLTGSPMLSRAAGLPIRYGAATLTGVMSGYEPQLHVEGAYLTFDPSKRMAANFASLLYVSGGIPSFFDGSHVGEAVFCHYPSPRLKPAAGGALTAGGTYQYRVTYAYKDGGSNLHRSASAATQIVLGGGNQTVNVAWTPCGLSSKITGDGSSIKTVLPPIFAEVYRTQTLGTILNQVSGVTYSAVPKDVKYTDSTGFADTIADVDIAPNPIIYTTGGTLDNVCPPSSSVLTVHKNRLWLAGCDDPKQIWYSKEYVDGEGPGFNEALTLRIDDGGDITALGSLDDKLLAFKDDRIFAIFGDGPTDAGTQNDLNVQRITTDLGCIQPRSVVPMPLGVMFQSASGIYLMNRGLQVEYIGFDVEDDLAAFPNITSATLVPKYTQVRFTCLAADLTAGIELRYDYRQKQWISAKLQFPAVGRGAAGATVCRGIYNIVTAGSSPEALRETETKFTDHATFVPQRLEFAPLSASGTQGYQDVAEILMNIDRHTPHGMSIDLAIDGTTYGETNSWTDTQVSALTKEQLSVHPRQTKNQAIRVRIQDTAPTVGAVGTGQGYSLASMLFKVAQKGEPQKQVSAEQKR